MSAKLKARIQGIRQFTEWLYEPFTENMWDSSNPIHNLLWKIDAEIGVIFDEHVPKGRLTIYDGADLFNEKIEDLLMVDTPLHSVTVEHIINLPVDVLLELGYAKFDGDEILLDLETIRDQIFCGAVADHIYDMLYLDTSEQFTAPKGKMVEASW